MMIFLDGKGMNQMTEIITLQIPQIVEHQDYNFLSTLISDNRKEQIGRYIYKEDAYRSLFAESLVRLVVIKNLAMQNRDIYFERNAYGKPSLQGVENFHFNISHAGCWVVLIWGETVVGIDIERIREIDFGLANRFFSDVEYSDMMSKQEAERLEYFYDLWTLKESYIKALGTGLSTPLDTFSIRNLGGGNIIMRPERIHCEFKQYSIDPNYKLSACAFGNRLPNTIQYYHYKSLINEMNNY
jgi:4'-phosphopantetheinyl transferase